MARLQETEEIHFSESVGRILAQNVYSDINMPPFDKSAMDGYACRESDLNLDLEIVEVIRAGEAPRERVGKGQCSQIMTGAMVPEGADYVIMVEHTEITDEGKVRFNASKSRSNICILGEDVQKGDQVLDKGTRISVRHIPVLATVGASRIEVFKQPRVAVLATGTELVEPENTPGLSQIRNSNASQMMAQLKSLGLSPVYHGIAPDDEKQTYTMLKKAVEESDILMLSGGVSMGEFDFVPSVLKKLGFELLFEKVAIQPGKPTTFGTGDGKFVFALPGNPVSSFIVFELLAKPFIFKCMGHDWDPLEMRLMAGETMSRKKTVRQSWFPVEINDQGRVVQLDYHGSAHIFALNRAAGIISMEIGQDTIKEGDWVNVRQI
jgi:molybdopterin molybdotransferase